jgi:hypothetical protein
MDGDITDPQTLNKYAYVRNNPVNLVDPSGLCIFDFAFCGLDTWTPPPPVIPNWSGINLPGLGQRIDPASTIIADNWGYLGSSGDSQGGSNALDDILRNLRLIPTSDCQESGSGTRNIYYNLVNIMMPNPSGPGGYTNPVGKYTVREHVTDQHGAFVRTSADYWNVFNDGQRRLLDWQTTDDLQTFTISPGDTHDYFGTMHDYHVPGEFGVPVRWGNQDYGTLGLWKKGALNFINGQQARACGL